MMKIRLLFIFFMLASKAWAQNHDYNCYFGYLNNTTDTLLGGMTLTFKEMPPKLFVEKKQIDFGNYSCVCSDSAGSVVFYTNGISIRNANHSLMENGDTINPGEFWESFKNDGYPSSAGAMAIPAPGFPNQYYLIHFGLYYDELNSDFVNTPLYYSLIDMNANNGLGRVIKKNQIILEGDLIPHTVVKHGNGRDWWIVTAQYNTPIHYVFLVSPAGIIGPLVQEIGPPFPDPEGGGNSLFTPDGRTYIRHDGWNGPRIYDFDRCTGQLSNLRIVPFVHPFATLQAAVSADSRFFYTSNILEVMQLDLWADDIGASMDTVAMYDGFVAPFPPFETGFKFASLGPDGKIYYATTGSTTALHIIHRPNLPGTACDIEQHGLKLPKFNSGSMPRFPNYRLGEWETSPCDTLNFQQPGNGFQKTYYPYEWAQKDTSYRLMTPIPHTPPSEFKLPKEKEEWHYEAGRVIKQNMSPGRQNFLKIRTKD